MDPGFHEDLAGWLYSLLIGMEECARFEKDS
jgi:hypothetical protein